MQVDVPVLLSETARTLQSRLDDEVFQRFDDFLDRLLACGFRGRPRVAQKINKARGEYYSRENFERTCRIDLNKTYRGAEFFNLLRGLTFFEDSRNAYIIDGESGKKIYVSINLREEQ